MNNILIYTLIVSMMSQNLFIGIAKANSSESEAKSSKATESLMNLELENYRNLVDSLPVDLKKQMVKTDLELINKLKAKIAGIKKENENIELNLERSHLALFITGGVFAVTSAASGISFLLSEYEVLRIQLDNEIARLRRFSSQSANLEVGLEKTIVRLNGIRERTMTKITFLSKMDIGGPIYNRFSVRTADKIGIGFGAVWLVSFLGSGILLLPTGAGHFSVLLNNNQIEDLEDAISEVETRLKVTQADLATQELEEKLN